jgi:hypothetical protein
MYLSHYLSSIGTPRKGVGGLSVADSMLTPLSARMRTFHSDLAAAATAAVVAPVAGSPAEYAEAMAQLVPCTFLCLQLRL